MEFKRLCQTQKIDESAPPEELCPRLAKSLQDVTIIQKGPTDIIANGRKIPSSLLSASDKEGSETTVLKVDVPGGLKRVGGQGDILSGSTAVLMAWGSEWARGTYE